jgi:transposase
MADTVKKGAQLSLTFCFYDESGFSEKPPIRKTWGKRGKTPIIRSTGSWKSLSITGFIASKADRRNPRAYFTVKRGSVRTQDTIKTLRHLLKCVQGGIALIWDGLPAHRAKAVRAFISDHKDRFRIVERFPAYAPELNPQEYIWSASKGKDMANFCPSKDNDLHTQTKKSLKRIQRNENIIQGALKRSGLFSY